MNDYIQQFRIAEAAQEAGAVNVEQVRKLPIVAEIFKDDPSARLKGPWAAYEVTNILSGDGLAQVCVAVDADGLPERETLEDRVAREIALIEEAGFIILNSAIHTRADAVAGTHYQNQTIQYGMPAAPEEPPKVVKVYGYSDDLIELEGAISAEYDCWRPGTSGGILYFNEGTILTLRYVNGGEWKAEVTQAGTAHIEIKPSEGPDSDEFSDIVTLTGVKKLVRFQELPTDA